MEMTALAVLLGAVSGILSGFIAAYVSLRRLPVERRTANAEATATVTRAAAELVDDLREEIKRLRDDLVCMRKRVEDLEAQDKAKDALIEELRGLVTTLQKRIRELETSNKRLSAENEHLKQMMEDHGN